MKNHLTFLILSSIGLVSPIALATPAPTPKVIAIKAPAVANEAKHHVPIPAFDAISEHVAALVQQQRLPEAIAMWQRVVDSFSAPGRTGEVAREAKEHAIALRGRAMLHRLNGNVEAALIDIEHACNLDARNDLAKSPYPSNLINKVFDNALAAWESPALSGAHPQQPLLTALNSERIAEAYAALGSFDTAEVFYRNAFNWRLKAQGAAHTKTKQAGWRVIELLQVAGSKFTTDEFEEILNDTRSKLHIEPEALLTPNGSKLKSMAVSPNQGALVFTASEPVLHGQRHYEDSFCGSVDVLGMPFAGIDEPDNITFLEPNADGALELQLLVRDGKDNFNYRFSDVRPGATTLASLEGNCALPRVKVSYSPTHSKLCLYARAVNQPVVSIVRDLISVTGISVQGTDLLGEEKTTFDYEIPAHTVLVLVADVAGLELETIDETHFAFRPRVLPHDFSTPKKLAEALQSALYFGDIDAELAVGNFQDTTPALNWLYLSSVVTCSYKSNCNVSVKADDPDAIVEGAVHQLEQGFEFEAQPAGVLVINVSVKETGAFHGEIAIPYGQINGRYRILNRQYTAKKLVELRAKTNAQLLDALFAQGIRENVPPYESRFDWKTAATVLPPGGGELGAAYEAEIARDFLRYSTGDLAAVLADGGDVAQDRYGDHPGMPIAKRIRVLELRTEAVRMLRSIKVLGGYQRGDTVVLDTLGKAENGWTVRGAVLLTKNSAGKFVRSDESTVSYPE